MININGCGDGMLRESFAVDVSCVDVPVAVSRVTAHRVGKGVPSRVERARLLGEREGRTEVGDVHALDVHVTPHSACEANEGI